MHAYLIDSDFNFTEESCSRCEGFRNERVSARRKNQTLEKDIQVLKKKSRIHSAYFHIPRLSLNKASTVIS